MPPDRVTEAARRFVPGIGPVSVERLGRGLVNESYRVTRDERMYSLRMSAVEPAAAHVPIGVDREWECRVLAVASAARIAPVIECCEPRFGVLVARWEEGHALSVEEARRPHTTTRVAELALRVHALALPGNVRVLHPADWIERYRDALAHLPMGARRARRTPGLAGSADFLQAQAERRLGALEVLPRTPDVLCHSDLHPANLIAGKPGLVLLDWEYAHVSEAFWDLAGWACNNDLNLEARALLLASYLGRQAAPEEERRLAALAWLYDYVCWLWSEVHGGATDDSDRLILERGRVLAARLERLAGGGPGELPAH
jgi:thiamine kinase-like enzyme